MVPVSLVEDWAPESAVKVTGATAATGVRLGCVLYMKNF